MVLGFTEIFEVKVIATKGGGAILSASTPMLSTSSTVICKKDHEIHDFFNHKYRTSSLHQLTGLLTLVAHLMSSQQGPFNFLFKRSVSRLDVFVPKT
jgi:hypothetical protein